MQQLTYPRHYVSGGDYRATGQHDGPLFPPGFERHVLGPDQAAGLPYLLHLTRELTRPPVATSEPQG